jgi:hypothetical protein
MNEMLLHSDHRRVSATHVVIFSVVLTRIKTQLQRVEITPLIKVT